MHVNQDVILVIKRSRSRPGWHVLLGPDSKSACEAYIETHWTDIRPLSARLSASTSA